MKRFWIKDYSVFTLVLLFISQGLMGQLIWTEPEFPTQLDDVTVYFDSNEGNQGLAGYMDNVYAHTGLITSNSSGPGDWKYVQGVWGTADPLTLMTEEGNGIYSISFNITDYYGVPMGELVEQMAFVFRNADGSLAGRETDGSDIFTEVYPPGSGLFISFNDPSSQEIIFLGDSLQFDFSLNKAADVTITDNGIEIYQGNTQVYDDYITPQTLGKHEVIITADDGSDMLEQSIVYHVIEEGGNISDAPDGVRNGVNYVGGDIVFQLFAPNKQHVFFLTNGNGFEVDADFRMNQSLDLNHFWIRLPATYFDGSHGLYQYLVDGNIKIADPYSELVLDPSNDQWVDDDIMDALPPFPDMMTDGRVTVFDIEKTPYAWTSTGFEKPEKENLIVYEILMRDFLEDHSYVSLKDTLSYLKRLGVTAIELMPVNEFEGNQSWGYNPSFHMALDKYYGSRDQFKAVVDEAHNQGIAVILDVVFNHCFSQSPLAQLYWDATNFRPAADNPWLNVIPKHPFNVGYDFNHEYAGTKEWTKRVLEHWIEEYRIDGFRFDLSKGLTQTNSGNNSGLMSAYDPTRISILTDYAEYIWSLDEDSYVILEHFADNNEEKALSNLGMMLWGNSTFQFSEAAMGYSSNLSGADYQDRGWNDPHLIAYMESHDEERMKYKINTWGNSTADYHTKEFFTSMRRAAAASMIYFSIPGPKMIWQFGELGYDYSINYCVNGGINENCRLDPKPIRWDYLDHEARQFLLKHYSAMTFLKNEYPAFSSDDYDFSGDAYFKRVALNHSDMDVLSIANFDVSKRSVNPAFQNTGTWYEYFSGEEVNISDTDAMIELEAGEYRLYTSDKIVPPNGYFTSIEDLDPYEEVALYPNVLSSGSREIITSSEIEKVRTIVLAAMTGNQIKLSYSYQNNNVMISLPDDLVSGVYSVLIITDNKRYIGKIVNL